MDLLTSSILAKTVVTHTVTYFVVGLVAFTLFDYPHLLAETGLREFMRPTTDLRTRAGALFQPVRGLILGISFVILRQPFFVQGRGWLIIWITLLCVGVFGTFGPTLASIEGMVFTRIPLRTQLTGLPEVLVQSFLLSVVVFHWVRHPEAMWISMTMWTLFVIALTVPILGLLVRRAE
jgi:hypothetical protein